MGFLRRDPPAGDDFQLACRIWIMVCAIWIVVKTSTARSSH
jgi:hypothetical protein